MGLAAYYCISNYRVFVVYSLGVDPKGPYLGEVPRY